VTTNLTAAPEQALPLRQPLTEPAAVEGRRGFAAVAVGAAGVGAAALAVPAGPVRLVMLLAFLLIGPGTAVMSHVRVRDRLVSWALAVTASLTVACGAAVGMLWAHAWRPRVAVLAILVAVAVAAVARVVLDRSVAFRPGAVARGFRTGRAYPVDAAPAVEPDQAVPAWWRRSATGVVIGSLVAAVALWIVSMLGFDKSTVDGYGLTRAIGVPFVAAVVLLCVAIAVELFGRARIAVLTLGLVAVSVVLQATVPLLYGNLEYAWTYKHIGVVDLLRDNGHLLNSTDIYQMWPGFFAVMAMVSGVAGVDALAFATWSSLAFSLLNMLVLAALLRQFTRNRRVIALGVLLFGICMWVDIGYFSPQAYVYTLMLGFWLITARWLIGAPAAAGAVEEGAGRIARARAALVRGLPTVAPADRRTRVVASVAATVVYAAITVSHQLTPFMMLIPAVVLAVLGVLRPRLLVVAWGLVLVAYVAPRMVSVADQYGLFQLDLFTNSTGNASTWRTGEQEFSALIARSLAIGVWLVALWAVWRSRRRFGAVLVPAVVGFAPFVTLGGQSYGGEAIYRVFAFSLPFAALLIAGMWAGVRRGVVVTAASGVVLAAVSLAALQGLQGQLVLHQVPAADITAARYFYAHARPNSSLVMLAPNFPSKLTANYGSFNIGRTVDVALVSDPAFAARLAAVGLPAVEENIRDLRTRDNYLVVSRQMTRYTDYFGLLPEGTTRSLQRALGLSSRWQVFYRGADVTIYQLIPPE
jgi:hypothetical protein